MLDQEGPKCEERQLNLMASLLAGRHRLPLSSSEHGLRREQRVSPSAGPAFGKLLCVSRTPLGYQSVHRFAGLGGG